MKTKMTAKPIAQLGADLLFGPQYIHPHQPCLVAERFIDASRGPVGIEYPRPIAVRQADVVLRSPAVDGDGERGGGVASHRSPLSSLGWPGLSLLGERVSLRYS